MKALILAGGKGTRLRPLTYAMAKQLVPVANKPILHYAMDSLYRGGIRSFGIIISPETGESIRTSLSTWKNATGDAGIELVYILQDEPAGLAHAVKIAHPYLGTDDFIMYLGDNLINADLGEHIQVFQKAGYDASILLKAVPNPSSFGVAELDASGQVLRLVEKPKEPRSDLALIGVYLFRTRIFEAIAAIQPSPRGELEITDAIQRLIDDNAVVHSRIHNGWWLDTGKKDDLLSANRIILGALLENPVLASGAANVVAQPDLSPIIGASSTSQTKAIGGVSSHAVFIESADNLSAADDAVLREAGIVIEPGAVVQQSRVSGPVIIGRNSVVEQAFIGPYLSIGANCVVRDCKIENSVLLDGCVLESVRGAIADSLFGRGCRVLKSERHTDHGQESHKFLLADHSEIQVV